MPYDDDLSMWDDDPVVQALRAPGTAAELAGEAEALAAFRSTGPRRGRRRLARRLGTGAGALGIAVALSGGVAAAYTHTLPAPVQNVAHGLFGAVGVPAVAADHHVRAVHLRPTHHSPAGAPHGPLPTLPAGAASPRPSAAPTPRPSTSSSPPAASTRPRPTSSHPVVAAPDRRTPAPSPHPSPSESSSTPPRPVPASLAASVSATRVPAGSGATVAGRLSSASGAPVPTHRVALQSRAAGQHQRWAKIDSGTTDAHGDISLTVPALSRNTRLRLVTGRGVHSTPATVVVVPALATSTSTTAKGKRYAVHVTSSGLQPGDTLVVARRVQGHRRVVHRIAVDATGSAEFFVPVPRKHDVTFHMLTARTASHAGAMTAFVASPG